jgi:hypothetical protein
MQPAPPVFDREDLKLPSLSASHALPWLAGNTRKHGVKQIGRKLVEVDCLLLLVIFAHVSDDTSAPPHVIRAKARWRCHTISSSSTSSHEFG